MDLLWVCDTDMLNFTMFCGFEQPLTISMKLWGVTRSAPFTDMVPQIMRLFGKSYYNCPKCFSFAVFFLTHRCSPEVFRGVYDVLI